MKHDRPYACTPSLGVILLLWLIDLSLGMGYGFTVTPVMLMLGYIARAHNVDFDLKGRAFRIAAFTSALGVLGAVVGVFISFNLPVRIVGLYIGFIVIASGLLVIISRSLISEFSWNKMMIISLIGSLNKGLTGSGFGPVITTGAMLSGIDERASVSIQSLSESSVSLVGFLAYLLMEGSVNYLVAAVMSIGVILASPIAARIVHNIDGKLLRIMVGILALLIGSYTLWKYF